MKFSALQPYIKSARVFNVDWDCTRYILDRRTRDDLEEMINGLSAAGMTVAQRHTVGENRFATLRGDDGDIVISYFNYNHKIYVITDEMTGRARPTLSPSEDYERLTTPKLMMHALDYTCVPGRESGMGFVMTLSDGSFLIYDGGYHEDGLPLLEYLEANNVRNEKPRVAAWILTHAHGDHFQAAVEIGNKYADRLTVEEFLINPRISRYEYEGYGDIMLNETFPNEILPKYKGAKLIKPHTGQLIHYRDAAVEILHTQEEILPNRFRWMNEISVMSRVYLGGQKILFPADGELGVDVTFPLMYGDALESDFIQSPHHGFSGGSFEFYDLVNAKVALFTCNSEQFAKYSQPKWLGGVIAHMVEVADETYCSGDGEKVFELPYTPTPKSRGKAQ